MIKLKSLLKESFDKLTKFSQVGNPKKEIVFNIKTSGNDEIGYEDADEKTLNQFLGFVKNVPRKNLVNSFLTGKMKRFEMKSLENYGWEEPEWIDENSFKYLSEFNEKEINQVLSVYNKNINNNGKWKMSTPERLVMAKVYKIGMGGFFHDLSALFRGDMDTFLKNTDIVKLSNL